jgi:hypothetical protein
MRVFAAGIELALATAGHRAHTGHLGEGDFLAVLGHGP